MSTIVYDQEYLINHDAGRLAEEIKTAAEALAETGRCRMYLGGTVYVEIETDSDREPGVLVEA